MDPIPILVLLLTAAWLFSRRKKQIPDKPSPSTTTSEEATPVAHNLGVVSNRGFDVFINFRRPDSRHTIADVLHNSLTRAGFRVFLDDEEIRKGEVIGGELLGAITNSKIYIPIFSKDYASSKWCLRELAKMIDCWETSNSDTKKVILPIFYDVDVSEDVKLRSQVYLSALQKHKDELGEAFVKPWEDALRKVTKIKGWNLKDHGLSELVDLISKEVLSKLTTSEDVTGLSDGLVGVDKSIGDIMELLEEESAGVRFIVIHGMGGIGKTTLADAVFKKISARFQGACFLRDVRRSASDGMVKLQEKLLLDTLSLNIIGVDNIDRGIRMISQRLRDKNVLIVLDDVDKRDHLRKLAADSSWFGRKSRIIITTRNIEFLPTRDNQEYFFYEMEEMNSRHALQLFCQHAFENDRPPPEFYDLSTEIVDSTGRLPLSLQVIGSSLYNQDDKTWKFRLEKLKKAPHKDVQQTLMISYEALEYEEKQIFLDIACLFNDEKKLDPIYFWEACEFFPDSGINILVWRSLIKVKGDDTLWMHDQLRDLGRAIGQPKLRGKESQISIKASRLWSPECALDALWKNEVDQSTEALKLWTLDAGCRFVRKEFVGAVNLRFLQLQGGNFAGNFKDVFQQLRWLTWFDCPLRFAATNLTFKNLVVLKLSGSQITEDWGGWNGFKEARHLKVLHLQACKCLNKTPDLSTFLELERLILRGCSESIVIDTSINKLKHLNYLEISNANGIFEKFFKDRDVSHPQPSCMRMRMRGAKGAPCPQPSCMRMVMSGGKGAPCPQPQLLQYSFGDLKSLRQLKIENMGLVKLHPSIGELVNLEHLYLRACPLQNLPGSIGKLRSLVELEISLSGIIELPDSIGGLNQLSILRMDHSEIEYLPDTIGELESLEELNLYRTGITQLPETIGNLKRLKFINVSWSKIKMLPKALVKLENLKRFEVAFCKHFDGNLPEEIGKLSRLRILYLLGTTVSRVPTTINQLSHLQELNLEEIHEFQELSELPTSLRNLTVMSSSLESHRIPDLSSMTDLVRLVIRGGTISVSDWTSPPHIQDPLGEVDEYLLEEMGVEIDFPLPLEWDRPLDHVRTNNLIGLMLQGGTSNDSHGTLPPHIQIPHMKWLAMLQKLEDLTLDLPDLLSPPTELGSLSRLQSLEITCFDTKSLCHLPSNLESLCLNYVVSPIDWQFFSGLNNLSTLMLNKCRLKEIKIDCLERLCYLSLYNCDYREKLSNLSSLKELRKLEVVDCKLLADIAGLGELKSLWSLMLSKCVSVQQLPNLSKLKKLEELRFELCPSLESIPDVDEEAPCHLQLFYCMHFCDFDGPYSKHHHY